MSSIGIPYAKIELLRGQAFITCPECDKRIQLHERKDGESWTGIEYAKHYAVHHEGDTTIEAAREFAYVELGRWFVARTEVLHMTEPAAALAAVLQLCVFAEDVEDVCTGLAAVGASKLARAIRAEHEHPRKRAPRAKRTRSRKR